jgi:hypothetical protein
LAHRVGRCVANRRRGRYERPLTGLGDDSEAASDGSETVAHVLQPVAVPNAGDIEPGAVVTHLEVELVSLDVKPNRDAGIGSCVFGCVLDRFQAAVVDRNLELGGEPSGGGLGHDQFAGVAAREPAERSAET